MIEIHSSRLALASEIRRLMDTIGKYKIVRLVGEGGMGRVYEVIDPVIGRRVAIKTISRCKS